MTKRDPAEVYASEQGGRWLYDEHGYCPFARHKLESLISNAFRAGAESIKKTDALTAKQREAVVDVLNARIAEVLPDALTRGGNQARETMRILERVRNKLVTKREEEGNV